MKTSTIDTTITIPRKTNYIDFTEDEFRQFVESMPGYGYDDMPTRIRVAAFNALSSVDFEILVNGKPLDEKERRRWEKIKRGGKV